MSMHIGKKIKIARITKGITQQELADMVNKTRPLISSIEQTGKVNRHTLEKICSVLGLTVEQLTGTNEPTVVYGRTEAEELVIVLEGELLQLKKDLQQMQELVDSQREVISLLKEKLERKNSK